MEHWFPETMRICSPTFPKRNLKKIWWFIKKKNNWQGVVMKKIAIMGARGFIGKNLTKHLEKEYLVFPITRENFSLLDENMVEHFIESNNIDVIVHCANEGGSRKANQEFDVVKNNLQMFFNQERCLTGDRKLISFGSGAQYDKARDLVKVSESNMDEVVPKDAYGYSKYIISKYCQGKSNIYNPIIFGLYGKHEDYTFKFISNAILKNLLHMPIVINQNVIFDYLYLVDFLKIVDFIIDNECEYNEFNMTPTKSIDLLSIAEMINACSEYKSEIIVKNEGMNYQYTGDNTRMLEMIGDFQFTSYQEGISQLYQYYYDNLNRIETQMIKDDQYFNQCKTK
ncbi:NAD-dependent epimerase/dehydratase family protein [Lachnotalea glycerini]|uniref:NAD-dependent epimerase/dehydratase family protein n=2 Tax=Lachnotalea glycerini TaxID=1763509 RepID=A0A371JG19_9FIRM|nr:NAD-dependent epimerase/dehydratase family protein [Lachnotalea glycerini]